MVFSLAPNKYSRGSLKIRKITVSAAAKRISMENVFPRMFSARFRSPFPREMAASGAPPAPIKELKADTRVMMGKVTPTPVRAVAPISGIRPM